MYRTLETIRDAGTTLLIIEQHVHHALGLADDAVVLVKGEVAYSGPVSELGDLQARVLGGGADRIAPSAANSERSTRRTVRRG